MKHSSSTHRRSLSSGVTVIEIIFGMGLFVLFLVTLSAYYSRALRASGLTTQHIQSGFLLEEGIEATRALRDQSWTTHIAPLAVGTPYYLSWNGTMWTTTTTPVQIENTYYRTVTLSAVSRDGNDDITSVGGVVDPNTKLITVNVAWGTFGAAATSSEQVSMYITNLFSN